MLELLKVWATSLWPAMENDLAFAAIGGIIIVVVQLINAGFGIWKNVGLKNEKFNLKHFLYTIAREVGLVALLAGGVALAHMLANLASLSILPGFEVGDVPTAGLLVAFGLDVFNKAQNIWDNLFYIFKGEDVVEEDQIDEEED